MIRDITIGQYYEADSPLHRLDPRVKLMGAFIYIISLFIGKNVINYAIAAVILLLIIAISRVPLKYILRGLKPIFILLVFSCVLNVLFTHSEDPYWSFGVLSISREGLINAAYMAVRLILLVIGSSMLTFTTTPTKLCDGLEKAFRPLNRIHVPVHEFAMMMSIALRFIPILTEELDKIMKAQAARCSSFEQGTLRERARGVVPIVVPLFVNAIRRAGNLALAMEARCYQGGEGRTRMYPLEYKSSDILAYLLLVIYLAAMIGTRIFAGKLV